MLQEVFYWIFNMSITAMITGVIVLIIRSIKKIPRRITVWLWLIPFLRMIVPIGLDSKYSLMTLLSRVTTKTVVIFQPAEDISFSMMNQLMAANGYFPITYKKNILEKVFGVASVIWVIIAVSILMTLAAIYIWTLYEMKDSVHLKDNIYLSNKIESPAVYGIIRPRIILPYSYEKTDIRFVLMHEKMHIRRADNLLRIFAFAITALHWFNPLAWIFLKKFLSDLELSCDECVLLEVGEWQAKEYARSILDCKKGKNVFASAFGGAKIRSRIENILSFKKMTVLSFVSFLSLVVVICYVLLTNAV